MEEQAPKPAPEPQEMELNPLEEGGIRFAEIKNCECAAGLEHTVELSQRLVQIGGVTDRVAAGDYIHRPILHPEVAHFTAFEANLTIPVVLNREIDHFPGEKLMLLW